MPFKSPPHTWPIKIIPCNSLFLSYLSHQPQCWLCVCLISFLRWHGESKLHPEKGLKVSSVSQIALCSFLFLSSVITITCTCIYKHVNTIWWVHLMLLIACFRGEHLVTGNRLGISPQEKIYSYIPLNSY